MRKSVEFLLLQFQVPGEQALWPFAVLLFDPAEDKLHVCGRADYTSIADVDDAFLLEETVKQLQAESDQTTGSALLDLLESTLSNSIRLTERIALSPGPYTSVKLDLLSRTFLL